ncbi:MAG: maleate cis-trans isomerase family protein, partial [Pikeienuella sp.]
TPETLAKMEANLPASLAMLPSQPQFDVIGYGCTSGAVVIGPERICEIIETERPGAKATNPISAVMDACRALDATRIGLVTPYSLEVSQRMMDVLKANGFEIAAFGSFEEEKDSVVARMAESTTLQAVLDIGSASEVEVVFASCTNLRAFGIIEEAEAKLGKPVISSNLALSWRMLRLAGVTDASGPGRLFQL